MGQLVHPRFIEVRCHDGIGTVQYDFKTVCADPELQARIVDKVAFQRLIEQMARAGLDRERVVPRAV